MVISQTFFLRYHLTLMEKFPTIENHFILYALHLTYSQIEKGGI
jgi:hypothetical protein